MYSRNGGGPLGRGGGGARGGRYLKGRLPEGVGFSAYPGRSSTPMPTAESKGAERMKQLKIWNEAAGGGSISSGGGKDGGGGSGRLSAGGRRSSAGSGSGSIGGSSIGGMIGNVGKTGSIGERRTDSYKEAKERHSTSFIDHDDDDKKKVNVIGNDKTLLKDMGVKEKEEARFDDKSESTSELDESMEDPGIQYAEEYDDDNVGRDYKEKNDENMKNVNGMTTKVKGVPIQEAMSATENQKSNPVETVVSSTSPPVSSSATTHKNTRKQAVNTDSTANKPKANINAEEDDDPPRQKERKRACCCVVQ